jgi:hypothetical protein
MRTNRATVRLNDWREEWLGSLSGAAMYRYPGQNSSGKVAKSGTVDAAMISPKLRGASDAVSFDSSRTRPPRVLRLRNL